jgi:DNA repair protein RadC
MTTSTISLIAQLDNGSSRPATPNAAAVILAHAHPSGVAEPSQADELITRRLKEALDLDDIRILDHIIVTGGDTISFAESGLL